MIQDTRFDNCLIGFGTSGDSVPLFNSCVIRNCQFARCRVLGADLVDCTFENIDALSSAALFVFCATLRRVRFQGSINNVILRLIAPTLLTNVEEKLHWTDRITAYYSSQADWALDISEARLGDVWLDGVPGDRIIIRPGRDGFMTREQARALTRHKKLSDSQFGSLVSVARELLEGPFENAVIPGTDSLKDTVRKLHAVETWAAAGYITTPL